MARTQSREGWLREGKREGKRQLEQQRWRHPEPVPRSRGERLLMAAERLEAELDTERRANEAYEHYRAPRATGSVAPAGRPRQPSVAARDGARRTRAERPNGSPLRQAHPVVPARGNIQIIRCVPIVRRSGRSGRSGAIRTHMTPGYQVEGLVQAGWVEVRVRFGA